VNADQLERLRAAAQTLGGRFQLDRLAASGGMGQVFDVQDKVTGRRLAIKIMLEVTPDGAARFAAEAEILERLRHPAIVEYVEHGTTEAGQPFLAMEWLEGETLAERLARAPLDITDALAIARRIASALAAVHAAGIVHRDLKPSNVFLEGRDPARAKLLDFGVARMPGHAGVTRAGALVGTLGYMAPEQAKRVADLDGRADLFSLGCVLYECVTGKPAFAGVGFDPLVALIDMKPPVPSEHAGALPSGLDELVLSLLAPDRDRRPREAALVEVELERLAGEDLTVPRGAKTVRDSRRDARAVRPGDLLADRYDIIRFLASGGMAHVYEANDRMLGVHVALKTIRAEVAGDPAYLERFRREIQLARVVTHRNVCRVFDLGIHETMPFFTMEMLAGETLRARLSRGPMPFAEARPLIDQMVAALAAAHAAGVVHRDFKSGNVMLVPDEGGPRAVVTDFGIAQTSRPVGPAITGERERLGTPAYMAPEQIAGEKVDALADIYALGIVMYEMATGTLPFAGASTASVLGKRLVEAPRPPRELKPDLDPAWERAILRCLERDAAQRFANVRDVSAALAPRAPGRKPVAAIAGIAAVALAGAGAVTWRALRHPPENPTMRVAVIGVRDDTQPVDPTIGTALVEGLRTELAAADRVSTVSGETTERVRRELALAIQDYAPATLAKICTSTGADLVLTGVHVARGGSHTLHVRLQACKDGKLVAAEEVTSTSTETLTEIAGTLLRDHLGVALDARHTRQLQAARPRSDEVLALYGAAREKWYTQDVRAALIHLDRVLELQPDFALARMLRAEVNYVKGDQRRSREDAERAYADAKTQALSPLDLMRVEAYYRLAIGQTEQSAALYARLYAADPSDLDAGLKSAYAFYLADQPERAFATLERLRGLPTPAGADPRIDLQDARISHRVGDFQRARAAATRALVRARALDAKALAAEAMIRDGWGAYYLLDRDAAMQRGVAAEQLYAAVFDEAGRMEAKKLQAYSLADRGKWKEAKQLHDERRIYYEAAGRTVDLADVLNSIGHESLALGYLGEAKLAFQQELRLYSDADNKNGAAYATSDLGNIAFEVGDLAGAADSWSVALAAFSAQRSASRRARQQLALARLARVRRDYAAAARLLDDAAPAMPGSPELALHAQLERAEIELEQDRAKPAIDIATSALATATTHGLVDEITHAEALLARAYHGDHQASAATAHAQAALASAARSDHFVLALEAKLAAARAGALPARATLAEVTAAFRDRGLVMRALLAELELLDVMPPDAQAKVRAAATEAGIRL
jgi:serine/threonine protein kinase/tetratricopeptide (TPR) repeat protein